MSKRITIALIACGLLALLLGGSAQSARAAAVWDMAGHHSPSVFEAGGEGEYSFTINNVGDSPATGPVTVDVQLPEGVTTRLARPDENLDFVTTYANTFWRWNGASGCPGAAGASTATCTLEGPVPNGAGYPSRLTVYVNIAPGVTGPLSAEATLTDENGIAVTVETAPVGVEPDRFGLAEGSFAADAFDLDGLPERRAGSHPFRAAASFDLNQRMTAQGPLSNRTQWPMPVGFLRNVRVKLPAGLAGNPLAVEQCLPEQMQESQDLGAKCPVESQVGTIDFANVNIRGSHEARSSTYAPVYNVVPLKGSLAAFAFQVMGRTVYLNATLDPRDYSVVTTAPNVNESFPVFHQKITLWGNPSDPVHDADRWNPELGRWNQWDVKKAKWDVKFTGPPRALISLPTECETADTTDLTRLNSWEEPSVNAIGPEGVSSEPVMLNSCNQIEFDPTVEITPTTNLADAPTGLEFDLHIPQNEDPEGLATAHLRDAVVKLPPGMTVNPPSADGLGACSLEQVGIGANGVPTSITRPNGQVDSTPANCPDDSKLGTAEAISPAIDHPIKGSVYLAEQNRNPFGSLIAMYLVLEDEETGILVKLPGRADPDPQTGQITATFRNNPQLPVEDLRLKLKEGPRAALKTPATCGVHKTEGTLTPWSAPEAPSAPVSSSFNLVGGPSGGACPAAGAAAPSTPTFSAGTVDPTAKAYTPFTMKLTRADGTQQLQGIDTLLPEGLTGRIAGMTYCSEAALAAAANKSGRAELASPSCPASSRSGVVNVGAGAGSTPLYVQGQVYLAGPYKGAPLSLAVITPAVAGPFDLGTVVVRAALHVDPTSAQIRAVSDPFPRILQGIPLNIRSIALRMDRPEHTLNPTSCDPMAVTGQAISVFAQATPLSERFQVGECNKLAFKPKLAMRFSDAPPRRAGFPALRAVVSAGGGQANIGRATVLLPGTELLEQNHIRTICTRVQWAGNACPPAAIYGKARAFTPLLDEPLEGPVYLRANGGARELPDLVADLRGQIDVELAGYIDTVKRNGVPRMRTRFLSVPDAPVTKFVLEMQGGRKGLLTNRVNLCKAKPRAGVTFDGQNGKVQSLAPLVKVEGCGKKKGK